MLTDHTKLIFIEKMCSISCVSAQSNKHHCFFVVKILHMLAPNYTSIVFIEIHVLHTSSICFKGVCALRGYFGPPMRSKNKSCSSQVSLYYLLEQ